MTRYDDYEELTDCPEPASLREQSRYSVAAAEKLYTNLVARMRARYELPERARRFQNRFASPPDRKDAIYPLSEDPTPPYSGERRLRGRWVAELTIELKSLHGAILEREERVAVDTEEWAQEVSRRTGWAVTWSPAYLDPENFEIRRDLQVNGRTLPYLSSLASSDAVLCILTEREPACNPVDAEWLVRKLVAASEGCPTCFCGEDDCDGPQLPHKSWCPKYGE